MHARRPIVLAPVSAAASMLRALLPALLLSLPPALLAAPAAAAAEWHLGLRAGRLNPSNAAYDVVYDEAVDLPGAQAELRFARSFLRLAAERGSASGKLVALLPTGEIVPLEEPTDITFTPVHLTYGWNGPERLEDSPWGVYLGGGATHLRVEEENIVENVTGSGTGLHVVAGARRELGERFEVAVEGMWFSVSGVFDGGAAQVLDDTGVDSLSGHLVFSVRLF
jgi:hypothetical protein